MNISSVLPTYSCINNLRNVFFQVLSAHAYFYLLLSPYADIEFVKCFTPVLLDPFFFNFTPETNINCNIFSQKLRINVLRIYFEQIVNLCTIFYSNTNSVKVFCEDSNKLNLTNFTRLVIFFACHFVTYSMSARGELNRWQ